jgi:hypothetical protein
MRPDAPKAWRACEPQNLAKNGSEPAASWLRHIGVRRRRTRPNSAQSCEVRRRSATYDVQVAISDVTDEIVGADWVDAATADASGGEVTPLRRFLWRYGRDVDDPRSRFRLLVETYLASAEVQSLPMAAAIKVFDELVEEGDGSILKHDILGTDTTTLSICPPVSFLDMLRLLDRLGSDDAVDIEEIGRRFGKLSSTEMAEVLNFASAEGNRLDRLREPIVEWTVRHANDELIDAEIPADLRTRILMQRSDLITSRAVSGLQGADLFRLFAASVTDEAKKAVVDASVRRDLGDAASSLLNQVPALVAASAITAARGGELNAAWLRPIASSRDKLLDTDLLQHAASFSHEGMVSVGGNLYSVPDATRKRIVEVHTLANEVQIFEDGTLIATHPVLEGRRQRRIEPGHRKVPRFTDRRRDQPVMIVRTGDTVTPRPLDFYQAVGQRMAHQGERP